MGPSPGTHGYRCLCDRGRQLISHLTASVDQQTGFPSSLWFISMPTARSAATCPVLFPLQDLVQSPPLYFRSELTSTAPISTLAPRWLLLQQPLLLQMAYQYRISLHFYHPASENPYASAGAFETFCTHSVTGVYV